jgi:hypothetical protein
MKVSLKGMINASKRANRRNSQVLNKVNADEKTKKMWARNNPIRKAAQDPKNKNRSTKTPDERYAYMRDKAPITPKTPEHIAFNAPYKEARERTNKKRQAATKPPPKPVVKKVPLSDRISNMVSRKIGGSQLQNVANKIKKDKSIGNMGMYLEKKDPGLSDGYLLTKQRIHTQMMSDRVKSNKGRVGNSWNIVKR